MGGLSYNQFAKSPFASLGTVVHGIVKNWRCDAWVENTSFCDTFWVD